MSLQDDRKAMSKKMYRGEPHLHDHEHAGLYLLAWLSRSITSL